MSRKDVAIQTLQQENTQLRQKLQMTKKEYEDSLAKTDQAKIENRRLAAKKSELRDQIEIIKLEKEKLIDEGNNLILEKEQENEKFQGEINRLQSEMKELNSELEELRRIQALRGEPSYLSQNRDITIPDGSKVMGVIGSERSIILGDNVNVKGDVLAQEDVIIGKNSVIEGDIKSNERVTIGGNTKISGTIYCSGTVTVGESSSLGKVLCNGDAKIGKNSTVDFVSSNESVELQDGVRAQEGVEFYAKIALGEDVKIEGEMRRKEEPTNIKELSSPLFADLEGAEKEKRRDEEGLPNAEEILALKKSELMDLCEELDIDSEGGKLELQARLIQHISDKDEKEPTTKKGRKKSGKKSKKEKNKRKEKKYDKKVCSTCGQDLIYITQYDKWYCYKCVKYEEK